MVLNENDYPMAYEEYEKRVIELFLESYEGKELELMRDKVEGILSEKPNFIEQCYGYSCFDYDHPEIYGDNCRKTFDDYHLRQTPVAQLRMIIG